LLGVVALALEVLRAVRTRNAAGLPKAFPQGARSPAPAQRKWKGRRDPSRRPFAFLPCLAVRPQPLASSASLASASGSMSRSPALAPASGSL
ncbi:MAG TPA: hypothetical protein PLI13_14060, partial [Paracoccus sp. (in: a-proteobacteria)]|nr:hypothetical protein [Paracoccus sp. (in: a-proteobacteria)]